MEFLDLHEGKFFTGKEMCKEFQDKMNTGTVYRSLKNIIKRPHYEAKMVIVKHRAPGVMCVYGKKIEKGDGNNGRESSEKNSSGC